MNSKFILRHKTPINCNATPPYGSRLPCIIIKAQLKIEKPSELKCESWDGFWCTWKFMKRSFTLQCLINLHLVRTFLNYTLKESWDCTVNKQCSIMCWCNEHHHHLINFPPHFSGNISRLMTKKLWSSFLNFPPLWASHRSWIDDSICTHARCHKHSDGNRKSRKHLAFNVAKRIYWFDLRKVLTRRKEK